MSAHEYREAMSGLPYSPNVLVALCQNLWYASSDTDASDDEREGRTEVALDELCHGFEAIRAG